MLKKILCLALVAMLPVVGASAGEANSYFSHRGWYAGGDVGVVSYEEPWFLGVSGDKGTKGFAANVRGGYQLLPNIAAEGDFAHYSYKSSSFNSVDLGVKAIMPLAAQWGVYAKAGMMDYYKDTGSVFEPFWGFGALYAVDRYWQLNIQMTGAQLNGLFGAAEVGTYTVGLVYFF